MDDELDYKEGQEKDEGELDAVKDDIAVQRLVEEIAERPSKTSLGLLCDLLRGRKHIVWEQNSTCTAVLEMIFEFYAGPDLAIALLAQTTLSILLPCSKDALQKFIDSGTCTILSQICHKEHPLLNADTLAIYCALLKHSPGSVKEIPFPKLARHIPLKDTACVNELLQICCLITRSIPSLATDALRVMNTIREQKVHFNNRLMTIAIYQIFEHGDSDDWTEGAEFAKEHSMHEIVLEIMSQVDTFNSEDDIVSLASHCLYAIQLFLDAHIKIPPEIGKRVAMLIQKKCFVRLGNSPIIIHALLMKNNCVDRASLTDDGLPLWLLNESQSRNLAYKSTVCQWFYELCKGDPSSIEEYICYGLFNLLLEVILTESKPKKQKRALKLFEKCILCQLKETDGTAVIPIPEDILEEIDSMAVDSPPKVMECARRVLQILGLV